MNADDAYEFAANVSLLFPQYPLLERFAAAARAGFQSVECWWPFGSTATPSNDEVEKLLEAIEASGLPQSGMNLFAGDMPKGERGVVSRPDRVEEFTIALEVAERVARRTGCRGFNALYGQRIAGWSDAELDGLAVENLSLAARRLGELGGTVLIEPLAAGQNGAYPITTAARAVEIVERVRDATHLPNVGVLFDTFHLASNGENLSGVISQYGELIAHVQLADAPGRGQPGTGTIDFAGVIGALWDGGYRGVIAAEYAPTVDTVASLNWVATTPHLALFGASEHD